MLNQEENFRACYVFTFNYAAEQGMKNVDIDTAIALQQLFIGNRC